MLASAVIVFREVIEAALIIGIVAAATAGTPGRGRWLGLGIAAGLAAALLVAVFAGRIADAFEGVGQELFNAGVMFVAVAMLGWHNVWMGRHARQLAADMKAFGHAVAAGERPLYAVAVVVGIAVLREGSEVALFLYGLQSGGTSGLVTGGVLGLVAGVLLGYLLYRGLVQLSLSRLFAVTSGLILLLAAGLAAQGAKFLVQAGYLPDLGGTLWDTSAVLSEQTLFGQMVHTLTGYTARPSGIQLLFYLATLAIIGGLMRLSGRRPTGGAQAVVAVLLAGGLAAGLWPAHPAWAGFKIDVPYVEEGEAEVEYEGFRTFDWRHAAKDNQQEHNILLGYGVNSVWKTEFGGSLTRDPDGNTRYAATIWENIFQLTEPGEHWADFGVLAEYDKSIGHDVPDQAIIEPIIAKDIGRITTVINLPFQRDIGRGRETGLGVGYAVGTTWRLNPRISPAVEAFGDLGRLDALGRNGDHRLGPTLVGRVPLRPMPGNLRYDVGYLFGLSSHAPAGTAKAILEYEFVF